MSLAKRALLYVRRNLRKSIVLFLILFSMFFFAITGLFVRTAADAAATQLRQNLPSFLKIETDRESAAAKAVTQDTVDAVRQRLPGVTACNPMEVYFLETGLRLTPGAHAGTQDVMARAPRFIGNADSGLNENFLYRTLEIIQGRAVTPQDRGVCVVSETLAQANHLALGDTITGTLPAEMTDKPESAGRAFSYEIIGIFAIQEDWPTSPLSPEQDFPQNFIFTDLSTAMDVQRAGSAAYGARYRLGASFILEDPRQLQPAARELTASSDMEGISVTVNDKAYRTSAAPLETLDSLTRTLVAVILVASALLLTLLLTLWVRDRKHEMGIYLSIGIRKRGVLLQLLLECVLIAAVAFTLAGAASGAASGAIGNAALGASAAQAPTTGQTPNPIAQQVNPVAEPAARTPAYLQARVGWGTLCTAAGAGMAIVALSVTLSAIPILRTKPKAILSSMS
nr:ABC transporter permease [Maliibacterium massiliense]